MIDQRQIISKFLQNAQAMNNPIVKNAYQMFQQSNVDGLKNLAENIAREKGVSIDQIRNTLLQQV